MLRLWVLILNALSALEFRIADKLGEATAVLSHFFLFWILPIILLHIPPAAFAIIGIALALFYVFVLAGDMLLSVFGHEELEKRHGMIDITSVHEMREEIVGALIKYLGAVVSFATVYHGLFGIFRERAFVVPQGNSVPYFDFFYFSVVTITTVGYGDIQPVHWLARTIVITEILFGLGFVLLLFTMLISVYIDIQRKRRD